MSFFQNLFNPGTKAGTAKIDSQTAQVLDLEAQKARLQIERDQITLELENQKRRWQMKLDEERHAQKLSFDEKTAVFNREKAVWETEKKELTDRAARDKAEFEDKLKRESELKLTEAVTLAKLDSQQQVKQAELDRDRVLTELRTQQAEALAKVKADTAEEYYKRMTTAFTEIQLNGDKSTKFVQELALKMFDSVPRGGADFNVGIGALPAPKSEPQVVSG